MNATILGIVMVAIIGVAFLSLTRRKSDRADFLKKVKENEPENFEVWKQITEPQ